MALLSRPWALLGIDDVEAFVVTAIRRSTYWNILRESERDDAIAACLEAVWRASKRHDPGKGRFSTVAHVVAQRALVDHIRRERGRSRWTFRDRVYERERPQFLSLDDERDGLDALSPGGSDLAASGDAALLGLVDERRRARPGDLEALGLPPARRTAR